MMKVDDVSILCGFVDSFDAERNGNYSEGTRRFLSSKSYVSRFGTLEDGRFKSEKMINVSFFPYCIFHFMKIEK